MKKINIAFPFEAEKASALRMYLAKKKQTPEQEFAAHAQRLYDKIVPKDVRDFIEASEPDRIGGAPKAVPAQPKPAQAQGSQPTSGGQNQPGQGQQAQAKPESGQGQQGQGQGFGQGRDGEHRRGEGQ